MKRNGYFELVDYPYAYSKFENGFDITQFNRRLYRVALSKGYEFNNPFFVGKDSFYELLRKSNLTIDEKDGNFNKISRINYKEFDKKLNFMIKLMTLIKKVLGIKKYILLIKFLSKYSSFESQYFLFKLFDE